MLCHTQGKSLDYGAVGLYIREHVDGPSGAGTWSPPLWFAMARSILIVDDDSVIRQTLVAILQRAGYETAEAESGAEALQKVRAGRFDLATMDIAMGSLDGVDTISVLRNEIDVRIVTISAHLTDAIRTDLYDREVRHFVEKPFTPKEILSVIRQALGEA